MSLMEFLSRFSTVTIQRSANYIQQIDPNSLDLFDDDNNKVLYAQIEGSDYYDTTITYSVKNDRLIDTDCSCPVGDHCKHAAALARFFYQNYRHQFQNVKAAATAQTAQNIPHSQATHWLNDFKNYLQRTESPPSHNSNSNLLIYILNLSSRNTLTAEVRKTRLNLSGSFAKSALYTSYDNILHQRLSLDKTQRDLFQQLYVYSQLNAIQHYSYGQDKLDISTINLEHLKKLVQSGTAYWSSEKSPALTWSDQCYQIKLVWHKHATAQTEKLQIEWSDPQQASTQPKNLKRLDILPTQPPCFIDHDQQLIGQLHSEFSAELLYQLQQMPALSPELMGDFEQIIHQHQVSHKLPKSSYVQQIEILTAAPQPILRFGVFPQFDAKVHDYGYAFAEIEFSYPAGSIKAGNRSHDFMGQYQGKLVQQQRDLVQEQYAVQQLQQLVPPLKWVNQLAAKKQPNLSKENLDALICATTEDWINQLIPINQIEQIGWQVEHTPQSLFHLQLAQQSNFRLMNRTANRTGLILGQAFKIKTAIVMI